jgi:hypothetical protein
VSSSRASPGRERAARHAILRIAATDRRIATTGCNATIRATPASPSRIYRHVRRARFSEGPPAVRAKRRRSFAMSTLPLPGQGMRRNGPAAGPIPGPTARRCTVARRPARRPGLPPNADFPRWVTLASRTARIVLPSIQRCAARASVPCSRTGAAPLGATGIAVRPDRSVSRARRSRRRAARRRPRCTAGSTPAPSPGSGRAQRSATAAVPRSRPLRASWSSTAAMAPTRGCDRSRRAATWEETKRRGSLCFFPFPARSARERRRAGFGLDG